MQSQWSDIRSETSYSPERFTAQVYQQVMSGKPRFTARRRRSSTSTSQTPRPGRDQKQSMVIELYERLRLAQLQLRGGADLAGRHREPSLGRVARWPRRDGRRPGDDGRHVRHGEGRRNVRVGRPLGEGMEFEEAWEQLGHITQEGAEAIKQIGGALPNRPSAGCSVPTSSHCFPTCTRSSCSSVPLTSLGSPSRPRVRPRVPRRADRCDTRSGGRSPLARSVT